MGASDGPPLLALHGVTGHGARWAPVAERGLPEWRWLAPDLRGHGASSWDAPWAAEQHVADLLDTLDADGVERCDVVGHSFGGLLATYLAAAAPQRVGRVALIDPAVAQPGHEMLEAAEETRHDEGWESREAALAGRSEGRPPQALPFVADDLEVALEHGDDGRYRLRYCRSTVITAWSEMARPPASLAGFGGELLLVPALQDGMVTPALRSALEADLGERFSERGIEASHMIYWDAFDELVDVLRRFLQPEG